MSIKESANGWPACMVQAHIDITTAAVPSKRSRRRSERRAWLSLAVIIVVLGALVAWGAMR